MRLAFLYIAEVYQLYHAAAVMFDLMQRDGVTVDVFHIDPKLPNHLELLRQAHDAPPVRSVELPAGLLGRAIQSVKLIGMAKPQVLAKNEALFADYDAIVSTEDGIIQLFKDMPTVQRPARIMITHGAGGRYFPSLQQWSALDLIVAKGAKDVDGYLDRGFGKSGQIVAGGYPKLVSTALLASQSKNFFANDLPIVLYNPHKDRHQRSWDRFLPTLLKGFRADRTRNLVVAPHVKLFRRRSEKRRQQLRDLSDETIVIDPGSHRSLDNSYTEIADIYVGDVSSQVVEFLARPRPCVFLNARRVEWRDDPNYRMWHLGEVIDDPAQTMAAIARAPAHHKEFIDKQTEFARAALGDFGPGSVQRSADLILDHLTQRKAQQ